MRNRMNKRMFLYIVLNIVIFAEFGYLGYTNFMGLLAHNPNMSHTELFYVIFTVSTLSMVVGIYLMTFLNLKKEKQLVEYKGGKCEHCGYDKCISALEFHHINPSEKDFGIGQYGSSKSFEKMKQEVDKCILLCCNCHRELHWKLDNELGT